MPGSDALREKLDSKGITVEEIREAVVNADRVYRGPRDSPPRRDSRCYFVRSHTDAGRALKVLVRRFEGGTARLITAWDDA